MRSSRCLFALVFLLTLVGSGVDAVTVSKTEVPHNRSVTEVLPQNMISGPHYRVRETVVSYGYMNHFIVDSDFGVFEVTGDAALRKLLREIQAIAKLREIKKGQAYLDAIKKAGKQPLEFGANLITDPVDTISGVPKGVARLFQNIGTSLTTQTKPGEDSRMEQALAVSSYKRDYAYQMGVDVYSSNPVLQKELNSLGWAGALGSLSVSAALAPVGGPAVTVFSTTRLSQQFSDLLRAEPPQRLRQINSEKLAAMGVRKDLAEQFLDHPSFTPRHDTVIVGSIEALSGANGRDAFIELCLSAGDEESANFFMQMAETLRGYHEKISPVKELTVLRPVVFARSVNNDVLVPFPLDYGFWTERADRLVPKLINDYRASSPRKPNKIEVWVTGRVTPLAKQQLNGLRVQVVEQVDNRIAFVD